MLVNCVKQIYEWCTGTGDTDSTEWTVIFEKQITTITEQLLQLIHIFRVDILVVLVWEVTELPEGNPSVWPGDHLICRRWVSNQCRIGERGAHYHSACRTAVWCIQKYAYLDELPI